MMAPGSKPAQTILLITPLVTLVHKRVEGTKRLISVAHRTAKSHRVSCTGQAPGQQSPRPARGGARGRLPGMANGVPPGSSSTRRVHPVTLADLPTGRLLSILSVPNLRTPQGVSNFMLFHLAIPASIYLRNYGAL